MQKDIIYMLATYLLSLQSDINAETNNIANQSAIGGKSAHSRTQVVMDNGKHRIMRGGILSSMTQGEPISTDNPMNIMISGEGVMLLHGGVMTRDGRLSLNKDRVLSQGNLAISDENEQQIVVPRGAVMKISSDGNVIAIINGGEQSCGRIRLFLLPADAIKVGPSMWYSKSPPLEDEKSTIIQGCLEQSNVDTTEASAKIVDSQTNHQETIALLTGILTNPGYNT